MKGSILMTLFLCTTGIAAQGFGSVSGTIRDTEMNNDPLIYAHVVLKNTGSSRQTNFHGNFEIRDIPCGRDTLLISFPGYETIEVAFLMEPNGHLDIRRSMEAKKPEWDDALEKAWTLSASKGNK